MSNPTAHMPDRHAGQNKAVSILGMHRSGTSTITRAINLLGAYLGEESDLMPPSKDNPEGFWERSDIADFHDRLLAALKRKWDTTAPLPDMWLHANEVAPFKEELRELVHRHFSRKPLWAWKDPRACLLFPLWREVLADSGTVLACVFVVRNPLDVARSLHKRDGIPIEKAYGIWFNHTISGFLAAAGLPTALLSYDTFLEGWEPELRRCAEIVGIDWPADATNLREAIKSFIRPDLRHSHSMESDLSTAPSPVRRLYLPLLERARRCSALDAGFLDFATAQYQEFLEYAPFFTTDLEALFEANSMLSELQRKECLLSQTIAEIEWRLAACRQETADIERQLAACRQETLVMRNSRSWKITSPLRSAATAADKIRKKLP